MLGVVPGDDHEAGAVTGLQKGQDAEAASVEGVGRIGYFHLLGGRR